MANVHPSKVEVSFKETQRVYELVSSAVKDSLKPSIKDSSAVKTADVYSHTEGKGLFEVNEPHRGYVLAEEDIDRNYKGNLIVEAFSQFKVIGQFWKEYLLCEGIDMLYIIDQHAAHKMR